MTPREVIDRACSIFINGVGYSAALKKTGIISVPVPSDAQVTPQLDALPVNHMIPVVTFTLEDSPSGARPCASYQGYRKFVD
jgi:hypothetical protein